MIKTRFLVQVLVVLYSNTNWRLVKNNVVL